jgi:hypothetical protein
VNWRWPVIDGFQGRGFYSEIASIAFAGTNYASIFKIPPFQSAGGWGARILKSKPGPPSEGYSSSGKTGRTIGFTVEESSRSLM